MNHELRTKNYSGFTLVEVLVVSALLFTVGIMVVQLFFSSLKGGSKSTILSAVKQNGDYALTVMERMIRNSREVAGCTSTSLVIKNPDGNLTTFLCDGASTPSKIASNGASLTSSSVKIDSCNIFSCEYSGAKLQKVGINFTVVESLTEAKLEEKAQMNFKTTVTLRNY